MLMRVAASALVCALALLVLSGVFSEAIGQERPDAASTKKNEQEKDPKKGEGAAEKPAVTRHEATIGGKLVHYTVTAGLMPIKDGEDKTEANIFYMAYTVDGQGDSSKRALMFSFNGGPGSSSVWLHLGALGPIRVKVPSDGRFPAPPFELVENESSWLDKTDLVFIDPVGTGFSRPAKPDLGKKFFGMQGDVVSIGEFIRLYLTRNQRWASPLYLVGESYGTTRAAGLSDYLVERGVAFNGIVLVSSALSFQAFVFGPANDLPYVLYLPAYTATAWYHKKLPPDLQADLKSALKESERWASTEYALALAKGDGLSADERSEALSRLARFTGLDKQYLDESNLRVTQGAFCRELLRSQRKIVGRLDSRFTGTLGLSVESSERFDPSLAAFMAPYTAMMNLYVRSELGYESDSVYHILGTGVGAWDWGSAQGGYPDTAVALRSSLSKNPHMKLFVASGYFDLATPYSATRYTIDHMGLDPSLRRNIQMEDYEAGHMMYVHEPSLTRLKADVASFLDRAKGP
jgi:carboxypeptidase C (cathepsin A)